MIAWIAFHQNCCWIQQDAIDIPTARQRFTFYPLSKKSCRNSIFHKYRKYALIELATSSSVTEKRRKCTLHFRVSRVSRLLAIVFKCNVLATYTYVRGTWLAIVAAPCTLTIIARSMHSIEDDKVHWYRFCANILISSSFSYCNYNVKCTYAFINFSILILRLRFRFVSIFNTMASFFFIASYIFRLARIILFDIWYNHTTSLAQELKSLFF